MFEPAKEKSWSVAIFQKWKVRASVWDFPCFPSNQYHPVSRYMHENDDLTCIGAYSIEKHKLETYNKL